MPAPLVACGAAAHAATEVDIDDEEMVGAAADLDDGIDGSEAASLIIRWFAVTRTRFVVTGFAQRGQAGSCRQVTTSVAPLY
jgi:hypothetical protein